MPGPRGKGKSMPKRQSGTSSTPASDSSAGLRDEIDNAQGWEAAVNVLCEYFKLPDLTTRSGLKKVHADFDSIYKKLDTAYNRDPSDERVVGTIIAIYAKMCADTILRDKLFKKGLVAKLMPLLDMPLCRHLALQSLSNITHNGGKPARTEIARHTPRLVQLLQNFSEDPKTTELTVVTLSHSIGAVTSDTTPDPKLVKLFDLPTVLAIVCDRIRKPWASAYLITHAEELISNIAYNCSSEVKQYPPAIDFLVAFLRSEDIGNRCSALAGLLQLVAKESVFDRTTVDPNRFVEAALSQWPDEVVDMQMDYGMSRLETFMTALAMRDFQTAMSQVLRDKDMYKLGRKLAELVIRTEFSMGDGRFEAEGEPRGTVFNVGLPFTYFSDALPAGAKAIRAGGVAMEQNLADILDCKFLVMKGRLTEAFQHARDSIERNIDVGYFFYILSLSADHEEGLRAAKLGRRCRTHMTPFIKHSLLHRAVEHASDMGISALRDSRPGSKQWKNGIGFLRSAYEDAKEYIASAPPDQRQMKTVMNWYILISFAIRGPELDADLRELQPLIEKLKVVEACSRHLKMQIADTQVRMARVLILQQYTSAAKEWGAVIKRHDLLEQPAPVTVETPEAADDLARWLVTLRVDEGEPEPEYCSHPKLGSNWNTKLYRCSNCGNPSSVLRKCSRCSKTRYCDGECQRAHWSQHKAVCKSG